MSLSKIVAVAGLAAVASIGQSFAGGESSGGGNGVVCFDHPAIAQKVKTAGGVIEDADLAHITSLEMVDLYQARKPRGISARLPEMIPILEDPVFSDTYAIGEYFYKIEERLKYVYPEGANRLKGFREHLTDEALRFHRNPVHQMRDADLEIELNSPRCTFTTMAYNEIISKDVAYIHFDERLFNLKNSHTAHSRMSKAVLVLHEYFYLMARFSNPETATSKKTRDYIGYLITQNTGVNILRFLEIADSLGFGKNPEHYYEFSKNGLNTKYRPVFASYPAEKLIRFVLGTAVSLNGAESLAEHINNYLSENWIHYATEVSEAETLVANVAPELISIKGGIEATIAKLEIILDKRIFDGPYERRVINEEVKARRLLAILRGYFKAAFDDARVLMNKNVEALRKDLSSVPSLSPAVIDSSIHEVVIAMESFLEAQSRIELVQVDNPNNFYRWHAKPMYEFFKEKAEFMINSAVSSDLYTVLKTTPVPNAN